MVEQSDIGKKASEETRKAFAQELSSHSSFTSAELEEFFPEEDDQEGLKKLIEIVKSSTNENKQKADLHKNFQDVGGAIIKVVKKIIP